MTKILQLSNDQRKSLARLLENIFEARIKVLDEEASKFKKGLLANLAKEIGVDKIHTAIQALQKERNALEVKLDKAGFYIGYEDKLDVVTHSLADKRYEAESTQYQAFIENLRDKAKQLSKGLWLANTPEEADKLFAEANRLTAEQPDSTKKRG